ncbi:MAG: SDR family oxidoreductase [Candidatus Omnitrophica bacterium]|nr:SDR family oxidoreductase [Candidatus Omnitrophota bacterium]
MLSDDKRVLITGASAGLGLELATLYAESGRNLVVTARRKDRLLKLKYDLEERFGTKVLAVEADLEDPAGCQKIIQSTRQNHILIDVLVNNAAIGVYGEFLGMEFSKIERMYRINVLSALCLTQWVLADMKLNRNGQVVNIASLGAFFPGPLMSVYFSAKADMLSFSAALNYEMRKTGIKITTVCPGPFKSEFQQSAFGHDRRKDTEAHLPSAKTVAQQIFGPVLRQKPVVIAGWKNKLIYVISRCVPLSILLKTVYAQQRRLRY